MLEIKTRMESKKEENLALGRGHRFALVICFFTLYNCILGIKDNMWFRNSTFVTLFLRQVIAHWVSSWLHSFTSGIKYETTLHIPHQQGETHTPTSYSNWFNIQTCYWHCCDSCSMIRGDKELMILPVSQRRSRDLVTVWLIVHVATFISL